VGHEHRARRVAGDDPRRRHHPVRVPRVAGRCLLGRIRCGAGYPPRGRSLLPPVRYGLRPTLTAACDDESRPVFAVSGAARRVRSELARSEELPPKAERRATKEQGSGRSCGRFWGGLGGYVAWKLRVFPVRPHAHTRDRNPDLGRGGRFLDGPLASCQSPAGVPVALAVSRITTRRAFALSDIGHSTWQPPAVPRA
jgi:hypothetical protein